MAEKKKDFLGKAWSAVSTLLPIVSPIATSPPTGRTEESPVDKKVEKYRRQVTGNVKVIARCSLTALLAGLLFASFTTGWHWEGIGILATAALACFLIGSTLGFVFGIPRSAQNPDAAESTALSPNAAQALNEARPANAAAPRENTNLEQISDWFVKILIGAGLVQLDKVKLLFDGAAEKLSSSLVVVKAAAMAEPAQGTNTVVVNVFTNGVTFTNQISLLANTIPDPANMASPFFKGYGDSFCLFLILYFMALGFLTSYLITRLWMPYVMRISALAITTLELEQVIRVEVTQEVGTEKRKEGARAAMRNIGAISPDPPPEADGATGIAASDPNKGMFGGKAEIDNLKLSADVRAMEGIDDDYFRIKMRVGRTDGKAFTDPVTFHLHPTFNPDTRTVSPVNNEATLECFAWGAFTVGVVVGGQGGKPTRLELDLSELPDAPALFKSR